MEIMNKTSDKIGAIIAYAHAHPWLMDADEAAVITLGAEHQTILQGNLIAVYALVETARGFMRHLSLSRRDDALPDHGESVLLAAKFHMRGGEVKFDGNTVNFLSPTAPTGIPSRN